MFICFIVQFLNKRKNLYSISPTNHTQSGHDSLSVHTKNVLTRVYKSCCTRNIEKESCTVL